MSKEEKMALAPGLFVELRKSVLEYLEEKRKAI